MYTNIVFNYIKQIGKIKYLPIGIDTEPMKRIIKTLDLNTTPSQFTVDEFAKELEGWGRNITKLPKVNLKDTSVVNISLAYAISKVDWVYIANSLTHHYKNIKPFEPVKLYNNFTNEESFMYSNYILFKSLNEHLNHNAKEVSRRILRPIKETGSCYASLLNYISYTTNMNYLIYIPSMAYKLIQHFYNNCDFINVANNLLKSYCDNYIDKFMVFYKEKELKNLC